MAAVVDTHFHIWDLQRFKYPWPTADNPVLYRNYTIDEYHEACSSTSVQYSIFIQVLNNCPRETEWALSLADKHPNIKGVVAGLDLTSTELPTQLEELAKDSRFVGVRHILDFEDEKWLTRDDVHRGLSLLEDHGKTFDLLLRPHLLKYVPAVVAKFPRLRFMINHIAKPLIKDQIIDGWKEDMTEIAKYSNVYCKISGLIPEADCENWKSEDFEKYIQHIIDIFGEDRCVFGSDWPVLRVSPRATYRTVFDLTSDLLTSCGVTDDGRNKIFGENAIRFYNLQI